MMSLVIDIHALQSLPPSNINRDDTGAPKSAVFGGVPRQRVSSQSWKRAIRRDFEGKLPADTVGFRTKRVAELVAMKVQELSEKVGARWEDDAAQAATNALFSAAKIKLVPVKAKNDEKQGADETGYLLFLSPRQIENAARAILAADGEKVAGKDAKELLNSEHSIDIAMFGRMVADDPSFNVDASVQVAHAIGIHESEPEFDYYTAVDDVVEDNAESGAGMIGTMQMMSSTLYRFATVDVRSLEENLGDENAAREAVGAFLDSFVTSLPTGKQNSYANNTLPELIYVTVRSSRSISLVNAFEEPVRTGDGSGRRLEGARRLAREAHEVETQYGFAPEASFVVGLGDLRGPFEGIATATTLPELADQVVQALGAGEPR
jgi:CRISPR system Cascade subunit CasC